MKKRWAFVPFLLFFSGLILLIFLIMQPLSVLKFRNYIAILFPKGIIALEERDLLFIIQIIMLLVIIPVYVLTFIFSWKYSVHQHKAIYDPDLVDNKIAEVIWWGLPFIFTFIIAVLTFYKTYELDPYKPIESDKKPITIQVVALQWKWLFIYPEEKIASVNFLQIPQNTPINFEITADAPMNSFWIPHLGGQIYAMPKMKTKLHLIANETGDFRGSSANLSGEGFSGMNFITRASSEKEYDDWLKKVKETSNTLDMEEYKKLAAPSSYNPTAFYILKEENLFENIIMKFMHPQEK